jgi:hypothetical protein
MSSIRLHPSWKALLPALLAAGGLLLPSPAPAAPLAFSRPRLLAVLPWAGPSRPGVPLAGPEGLLVDLQGRIYLQSGLDFTAYSPGGKYLRAFQADPLAGKFFGFFAMEPSPDGKLLLLARLESPLEEANKDNFEERSQPGARLLLLDGSGKVLADREYLDKDKPHSDYFLDRGKVYSLHDDGSVEALEQGAPAEADRDLGDFARITRTPAAWLEHVRGLPVFRAVDRSYHDIWGGLHIIRGAVSYLMGRHFVEGLGPLGFRRGRIYYQALCDEKGFRPVVFVEEPRKGRYGMVDLVPGDGDLEAAHGHAVFVDQRGDIYEGVAHKEGYRIYRWTASGE